MAFPKSVTLARLVGLSLLLSGVACSALSEEEQAGSQDDALEAQFNKNNVVSDAEFQASTMTVADVQRFLDKTPYGSKSGLAAFTENGRTAAQILHAESIKYNISPLVMLARIQTEQGLISKTTASATVIDKAFGCGCPDNASCGAKYLGLANQTACAAGSLRRSLDRQAGGQSTVSGWKKGLAKKSQDAVDINPENAATAALYTYTPWVGESGGGKTGVGGTSLYFKILKRFTDAHQIAIGGATGAVPPSDAGTTPPRDAAPAPAKDAGPVKDGGPCGCTNPAFPICDTATMQCVGCLQDSQCTGGDVCDTGLKKCVECTTGKTANCDVDGAGSACLPNKTCGCNSDVECGTSTSGRVCGAAKVCQEGCRGTAGNRCPAGQTCSSASSAIGTCSAAAADASVPPPADSGAQPEPEPEPEPEPGPGTEPTGPSPEDPDLEGHPTPASNNAPPPQRNESVNLGAGAGPDLDLGRKDASAGGCNTGGASHGSAGMLLGALGLAVLATTRRRKSA